MVVFTLRIVVPPRKRGEIIRTLRSLMGPTHAEPGCMECRLQQDASNPNALTFVEEWEDQLDLDRHMSSNEYRKLLAVMDMAKAPPKVTFLTVSSLAGFEKITAAQHHDQLHIDGGPTQA